MHGPLTLPIPALAIRQPSPWTPTVAPAVDDETRVGMDAIHEASKNDNTDRAHRQDLAYFRGWMTVARGEPWALPLAVGTVLAFIAWHLTPASGCRCAVGRGAGIKAR